jgi:hypothetical protein
LLKADEVEDAEAVQRRAIALDGELAGKNSQLSVIPERKSSAEATKSAQ